MIRDTQTYPISDMALRLRAADTQETLKSGISTAATGFHKTQDSGPATANPHVTESAQAPRQLPHKLLNRIFSAEHPAPRTVDSLLRMVNDSMQIAFVDAMLEAERRARDERKRAQEIEDTTITRQPFGVEKAPDISQMSDSVAGASEATGSAAIGIGAGATSG